MDQNNIALEFKFFSSYHNDLKITCFFFARRLYTTSHICIYSVSAKEMRLNRPFWNVWNWIWLESLLIANEIRKSVKFNLILQINIRYFKMNLHFINELIFTNIFPPPLFHHWNPPIVFCRLSPLCLLFLLPVFHL